MTKIMNVAREEIEVVDEKAHRKAAKILGSGAGYKTGYGSWVMRPGYRGKGDYMDKGSAWHY